jgi:hypothetical protein
VASFEKLRALNPEMFYVTGWAHGGELLQSGEMDSLADVEEGQEVTLKGSPGANSTLLGYFALDLVGVDARDVALAEQAEEPDLVALERDRVANLADYSAKVLLTTGDAARLIPMVAIAQRGLVRDYRTELITWTRVWLEAIGEVEADAAAAARLVAAQPNSPEPVELLAELGAIAPASLTGNTEVLRLSGRGALSLDVLFFKTYELWRGARLVTSPPPAAAPVTSEVVGALALREPSLIEADPPEPRPALKTPMNDDARVLLAHAISGDEPDPSALIDRIGLLSDVFPRSPLRLTVHESATMTVEGRSRTESAKELTTHVIERATERYELADDRVQAGAAKAPPDSVATIEVMSVD